MKFIFLVLLLSSMMGCTGSEGGGQVADAPNDLVVLPSAPTDESIDETPVVPENQSPIIVSLEPGVTEPVKAEPDVVEPEEVQPEVVEPEVAEPEVVEPEVVESEVAEPEVVEPEVVEPEVAEPEVAEPEVAEPEVVEPEVVEPEVVEPEVAEPEVAEPEVAEPEVAEPEVAEPEVAEPEVAEPEVAEPEVAEPEVAEPEVTEQDITEVDLAEPGMMFDDPLLPLSTSTGGSSLTQVNVYNDNATAFFVRDPHPFASDSPFRPMLFSVPSTVSVSQNTSVRFELGYGVSSPIVFLHLWSNESEGYLSLAISDPAGSQLSQALSVLIEPRFDETADSVCYQFIAEDSKGLLSDATEICFEQTDLSVDERVFRYFDRHFAGGIPTTFLETYFIDSGKSATSNLGSKPYQSLVEVQGKSFVSAADRLLLIDPASGETQGVIPLVVEASTSMGSDGENVFLIDHLGDFYRINAATLAATHVTKIDWSVLSFGDLVYLPATDTMLATVRFRETDNDYLFSINRLTGEYSIIGVTGARGICELIVERNQLLGLGCDGKLLLIDPTTGETAEISAANSQVGLGYFVKSEIKTHYTASDLQFPGRGVDWRFWGGSSSHHVVHHSNRNFDDSHAYDMSKDGDVEAGIAITPVAPGDVLSSLERIGFVLVKHYGSLVLDDGSEHPNWYSGYMHMSDFSGPFNGVSNAYVLGYLSDTGTSNNHLHFGIYVAEMRNGVEFLSSIDIATQLKALSLPISRWIDGCMWPDYTYNFDQPWWSEGQTPCEQQL